MSNFDLPIDMPTPLKNIILEARRNGIWQSYNLQPYSTKTLAKCLQYLEKIDRYLTLQGDLKKELKARQNMAKPVSHEINAWFPELWWAVISLFGKGEMDRNATRTKDVLSRIDPAWSKNCGARY